MANTIYKTRTPKGIKDPAISLGVVSAAGIGLYFFLTRRKEEPLPETPPPPPPQSEVPEIDPILNEIDAAIAKLREIIDFLKKSVQGADELIKNNETTINNAQAVVNEIKPKIANKTVTQQDAERLLVTLESVISQFTTTNSFLAMLVNNVNKAIQDLQNVVNSLEKQISDLRYQLEPVPVEVSVAVSGTHASAGARSAPVTLSIDQTITITGRIEAAGSYPFGCTGAYVNLRNKASVALKSWGVYACCHLFSCDSGRAQNISGSIQLPRGLYTIEVSVTGTGGGGGANAKVSYKTARFLLGSISQAQPVQQVQPPQGGIIGWISRLR